MTGRATAVLDRFPCHLSLADPHKRFRRVTEGICADLDVQARQIGDVRKAHRLAEAPTGLDVSGLGDLHAIAKNHYRLTELRTDALAAADPDDTALLNVLTNLTTEDLESLSSDQRLSLILAAVQFSQRLFRMRSVVTGVIDAHRRGNGTATSLLVATTTYLGFNMDPAAVHHYEGRWWHTISASDRLAADAETTTKPDLFAIEENPFVEASISPVERIHGDRFRIRRGGLEDVITSVVVIGRQNRTVAPMVVNLDVGQGVVYDGLVDDGSELVFGAQGQVTLDDADVTGTAFIFTGGVFADETQTHPNDFVFASDDAPLEGADSESDSDRIATWVVTSPIDDGFEQLPTMPHGGSPDGLPLALGETRWAAFVRSAHYGSDAADPEQRASITRNAAGRFDESVFGSGPGEGAPEPFGAVGFRWSEREPFALRILLPPRLAAIDDDAGTVLREPLRVLLDRHRPAGVHLTVGYGDPQWDLGQGLVRDSDSTEPLGTLVVGTTLWPDGTTQPTPT